MTLKWKIGCKIHSDITDSDHTGVVNIQLFNNGELFLSKKKDYRHPLWTTRSEDGTRQQVKLTAMPELEGPRPITVSFIFFSRRHQRIEQK